MRAKSSLADASLIPEPSLDPDKETIASRNNRNYLKKSVNAPRVPYNIKKKRNTVNII